MAKANPTTPSRGFTSKFLDNLKPKDKRVELADKACPGLRLRLEPSGRKSFVWYYSDAGRNRVLTLGRYGDLSLAQARKDLQAAKEKHTDGATVTAPTNAPKTVEALAEQFYKRRIVPHRDRPDVVRAILDNDVIPQLGRKKLSTVSTQAVSDMVEQVTDRGCPTHAGKVLAVTKQMFRFAEARSYITHSPAGSLDKKDLGCVDNVRDRHLSVEEIPKFWEALDRYTRLSEPVRIGLKLLLLTGVRTSELLQAKWEHIRNDEWSIPESNSKTVAWTVPVVPMVRALFNDLRDLAGDRPWVMPGLSDGPIGDKSLARAMRRLFQMNPDLTPCVPHDFRRTLRTHLEDLKATEMDDQGQPVLDVAGKPRQYRIEPHIAEKCLNHSLGKIEKTYNKNALLKQRREALQTWAVFVAGLVAS